MPSGRDTAAVTTICRDLVAHTAYMYIILLYIEHWLQLLSSTFIQNLKFGQLASFSTETSSWSWFLPHHWYDLCHVIDGSIAPTEALPGTLLEVAAPDGSKVQVRQAARSEEVLKFAASIDHLKAIYGHVQSLRERRASFFIETESLWMISITNLGRWVCPRALLRANNSLCSTNVIKSHELFKSCIGFKEYSMQSRM